MTPRARLAALAGGSLAAGLAVVLVARAWLLPAEVASPIARGSQAAGKVTQTAPGGVETLGLGRLGRSAGAPEDGGRDPFRYRLPPPPPKKGTVPLPPMYGPQEPAPPPPPPPLPPIPLKFVGVVDAGRTGRVAVLSDSRGSVFYGKEGDIIDGRYRLIRVAPEQAELAYVDGRGRQALRLSGQ